MTRAVIDTNVWVAGLLSRAGPPARIVDMALRGEIVPVVGPAMLDELYDVLRRPELRLPERDVAAVLTYLRLPGDHVRHVDPISPDHICSDPDDDIFAASAVEGGATHLITGNLRHFPPSPWRGILIVKPAAFLSQIGLSAAD
ncbi:MAG TPA: putative toxin-antitoxin system toxin component, PIN family [Anaerolineales bacterium]